MVLDAVNSEEGTQPLYYQPEGAQSTQCARLSTSKWKEEKTNNCPSIPLELKLHSSYSAERVLNHCYN
uniref:Bm13541 n=1 Tax=Brugia malayi TaxID=6279 RepID=A0A0J9Y1J0_BRUMA|nr:Bm13541 [Brugia malayi]